jgi:putative transposase
MLHEDFEMAAAGNHAISKRVVEDALERRAGICREEETGIRGRTIVAKAVCRDHSGWSFFQLRTCVAYKANIAGIRVEKVARAAALLGRAEGKHFACEACGQEADADRNAADNLRLLGQRASRRLTGV